MFHVKFATANSAFDGDPRPEIARILREIAREIEHYAAGRGTVVDSNGNIVGEFRLTRG